MINKGSSGKEMANRTRTGFVIAFILLLVGNVFSYITTQKVSEQSQSVNHTNLVIESLEASVAYTMRAESAFRGYLIDQDKLYYDVFKRSIRKADSAISIVKEITLNSPAQQESIRTASARMDSIFDLLELNFKEFRTRGLITDSIRHGSVNISLKRQQLEALMYKIQSDEKQLWSNRSGNISRYITIIKLLSVISTFVAILLTLYSILVFNKEKRAKDEADKQAHIFREQLENRVRQLAEMNTELIELRGIEKFAATGRIARTIAHEVRNPLTNINLAVEQLKTEFEGTENADIFFDMISRNSVRINNLVSNLLNATKLTEVRKDSVSINSLIDACIVDADDRIKLNHIKILKYYDTSLRNVSVDVEKMKIALLNLIVNGIEAMSDGGTLTITTTADEKGKCMVKISDTGVGVSKEYIEHIFEPFFSTKKTGNGLGLANTHNIILSHNGSIKVESEEGTGTIFTIKLDFG